MNQSGKDHCYIHLLRKNCSIWKRQ